MSKRRQDTNIMIATKGAVSDEKATTVEIEIIRDAWETRGRVDSALYDHFDVEQDGDRLRDSVYTGAAVRHPSDKYDADLGYDLAFWRAVEKAAKHHLDLLQQKIDKNDRKKAARLEQEAIAAEKRNRPTKKFSVGDRVSICTCDYDGDNEDVWQYDSVSGTVVSVQTMSNGETLYFVNHPHFDEFGVTTTLWPEKYLSNF